MNGVRYIVEKWIYMIIFPRWRRMISRKPSNGSEKIVIRNQRTVLEEDVFNIDQPVI
jgi:hypothetical protein